VDPAGNPCRRGSVAFTEAVTRLFAIDPFHKETDAVALHEKPRRSELTAAA